MFFWILVVFILGSAVGSFLNVVIDRTTRGESISGRSYCDFCKATLATIDLVPIISFVGLGGKCRYCKKPLSWQYPTVESTCAILFILAFWILASGQSLSFASLLFYFLIISVSIVVAIIDLKYYLIPTTFVYAASLITLVYNYFFLEPTIFGQHVFTAFVIALFFLLIVLITRGRGMGQGDVVLAFLIGMVLGPKGTFVAIFLAFLVGAVVSLLLVVCGKKRFGETVPFGPFLILGFLASLFWSGQLIDWYLGMLY